MKTNKLWSALGLLIGLALGLVGGLVGGLPIAVLEPKQAPIRQLRPGLMVASWYGPGFNGQPTASGGLFYASGFTAAHRSLPFGTRLLLGVQGRWVEVVVTDRGPVPPDRDIDVSEGAAEVLGLKEHGLAILEVIQLQEKP